MQKSTSPSVRSLRSRARKWITLGLLAGIAFVLRSHQWLDQVVTDDEWHALHMVMNATAQETLTTFGLADHSIPLTLYFHALANTVGLSETGMRVPMLAASIASIAIFGAWVWSRFGARVSVVFCTMMIVSPLLFYYSRIARPYGLSLLFAPLCLWWFHVWWSGGSARHATAYGVSAVLLTWLHLLNAPFVFMPLLLAALKCVNAKERRHSLITLVTAVAIGLCFTVGLPFVSNPGALGEKIGEAAPTWSTLIGALHQWFGTSSRILVIAGGLLAVCGSARLTRIEPTFFALYALGLAATLAAMMVLQPAWMQNPLTFARYLVLLIPLLLLLMALGLVRVSECVAAPRAWLGVVLTILATGAWLTTPLHNFFGAPMQYTNHAYFHFDVRATHNPARALVHRYAPQPQWDALSRSRIGEKTLAFFPWNIDTIGNEHPIAQQGTGQRLLPFSAQGFCTDWMPGSPRLGGRVELNNFATLSNLSNLDIIVMRKSFVLELDGKPITVSFREEARCDAALRARFGAPLHQDAAIVAYQVR